MSHNDARHHIIYNGEGNSGSCLALPLARVRRLCESVAELHPKSPEQRGQIAQLPMTERDPGATWNPSPSGPGA
jgi:hypothetical protein